ncbi:zinc finger protein 709-like [Sphaeramia orbicularis]|uniref:zinc finger protein 709-like n=1 Tax=Sphaeramia orbicularis TaxID=375764 RepID=UPI0011810C0D|nr:zinc finger protein 709-like [Sphaeramia orbicularis]
MGEVTVEVTKQDFSMELLPEPVLIILSPPPSFLPTPGEPVMFWNKWLKAFENYVEALGESELVDSTKCLLLQNCLGQEGQRIFTALTQGKTSYHAIVSALTVYFNSDQISQECCLKFHQRTQMPGETVGQFVSALEELLKPCNYGDSEDKLILSQLIDKTNCAQIKERLQQEKETLTLSKALVICEEMESSVNEYDVVHEVSVDIGDDLDPPVQKRKRGRPRRGENKAKTNANKTSLSTSSRHKNEYYYSNETRYYGVEQNDEHFPQSKVETNPTSDEEDNDAKGASTLQRTEEEEWDKTSESSDHDDSEDEDFFISAKHKRPFCPICIDKRFRDAHKLARHMRTHTKEKPFVCPVCSITFSQSYHMTRHMRNQHGAGQHVCSTCGVTMGSLMELRNHKKTHVPKILPCPFCQEKCANYEQFLDHIKTHGITKATRPTRPERNEEAKTQETMELGNNDNHESDDGSEEGNIDADSENNEVQTEESELKMENKDSEAKSNGHKKDKALKSKKKGHFCPICVGRRFRGPNKLARHMRSHTKEKPFSCPVCALTFSQSYHMTRHLRNQHGLGHYICTKCGKNLETWQELNVHKKTHAADDLSCPVCDKQFKDKASFTSHIKSHKTIPSSPQCLICAECGKVFGRMYHLKRHIATHRKATNGEFFTCPKCEKIYAFQEDLIKHLEIHVKESNGVCPKCKKTFTTPQELEAHMEVHEKSYTCNTCGKKFKVEYALRKHELGHENEQYYCSLCRKRFIKLSHYKRHLLVHNRRESKCPHCDAVFLKLTALKYHLRTHTEERPYQCTCCIETFEEKGDLEQHRLKHRKFKKERPYSCTRCDNAFLTLTELTEHMSSHEGEHPMNCPVCGKTFLNKNKLEKHLSIHTGERPHLCSICGNGFPSAASLKLHVHIHTGEKPYQCSQCTKSFRSSSGLRLHSRQHMEVRPSYECPQCGRSYGRMTELKMHQRYHTGDKPYSCTCCNKRFITKDKLNVHMRIHTGERPYSCPHCGQTFTQTGDRNRHINKYH